MHVKAVTIARKVIQFVFTCMYVTVPVYRDANAATSYIYIYIYIHTCDARQREHTFKDAYIYIYTHTHTHTYMSIDNYIHIYQQAMLDNGSIRSSIVGGVPRGETAQAQALPPRASHIPQQHKSLPMGAATSMQHLHGEVLRPHSMPANLARPQSAAAARPAPATSGSARPTSGMFFVLLPCFFFEWSIGFVRPAPQRRPEPHDQLQVCFFFSPPI
jgi:hypothetical protein